MFISGATLEDDDLPLTVRMVFDPHITGASVTPPAYVIARDMFISDVQSALDRYMELTGQDVTAEYVDSAEDDYEEPCEEEDYEEDDSPAFGEHLKPKTVN